MSNDDSEAKPGFGAFARHHSKFFSILGLLVVFLSFVTKEAIRESLKDLSSSLDTARTVYLTRKDISYVLERLDTLMMTMGQSVSRELDVPLPISEMRADLDILVPLLEQLPNSTKHEYQTRSKAIYDRFRALPKDPREDFVAVVNLGGDLSELTQDVLDQSEKILTWRKKRYDAVTWIAYGLFAFGWAISLVSALYGVAGTKSE